MVAPQRPPLIYKNKVKSHSVIYIAMEMTFAFF